MQATLSNGVSMVDPNFLFFFVASPSKTCVHQNVDLKGDDLDGGMGIYKSSQEECQRACEFHTLCRYWTFTLKNWASNCYLKNDASNPVPKEMFVSGPKYCP